MLFCPGSWFDECKTRLSPCSQRARSSSLARRSGRPALREPIPLAGGKERHRGSNERCHRIAHFPSPLQTNGGGERTCRPHSKPGIDRQLPCIDNVTDSVTADKALCVISISGGGRGRKKKKKIAESNIGETKLGEHGRGNKYHRTAKMKARNEQVPTRETSPKQPSCTLFTRRAAPLRNAAVPSETKLSPGGAKRAGVQ